MRSATFLYCPTIIRFVLSQDSCSFEQSTNARCAEERLHSASPCKDWGLSRSATTTTPVAWTTATRTVPSNASVLVGCVPVGSTIGTT